MLGVGVGFDTSGAGKLAVHKPLSPPYTFVVPDCREVRTSYQPKIIRERMWMCSIRDGFNLSHNF
jgi:hypothetical protein